MSAAVRGRPRGAVGEADARCGRGGAGRGGRGAGVGRGCSGVLVGAAVRARRRDRRGSGSTFPCSARKRDGGRGGTTRRGGGGRASSERRRREGRGVRGAAGTGDGERWWRSGGRRGERGDRWGEELTGGGTRRVSVVRSGAVGDDRRGGGRGGAGVDGRRDEAARSGPHAPIRSGSGEGRGGGRVGVVGGGARSRGGEEA